MSLNQKINAGFERLTQLLNTKANKPTHYRQLVARSGSVYLRPRKTNANFNYWVSSFHNAYGEYFKWVQTLGSTSKDAPYYTTGRRGYVIKAGTTLQNLEVRGRLSSATDVKEFHLALIECVPQIGYEMNDRGYLSTSQVQSNIILRERWFTPVDSVKYAPFTRVDNYFRQRIYEVNHTFTSDCFLILCFKPDESATNTKNIYFYADVVLEFDCPL